jgi:hypothetical protein
VLQLCRENLSSSLPFFICGQQPDPIPEDLWDLWVPLFSDEGSLKHRNETAVHGFFLNWVAELGMSVFILSFTNNVFYVSSVLT